MRPMVHIKYGIGKNAVFGQVEVRNGKQVLTGFPCYRKMWSICHVTYEEKVTDIGEYTNGSYTHLLGLLQQKKIDAIMHLHPYSVNDDAFKFSRFTYEYQYAIHSFTKPMVKESVDVITSLNTLDAESWIFLFLVAFVYFVTLKVLKIRVHVVDLIGEFFQQFCYNYSSYTMKLYSFFLVSVFSVFLTAISAYFSTELTLIILPPRIETLYNIVQANVTPVFLKIFQIHQYFENPLSPIHRKVWQIVGMERVNYNLMDYSDSVDSVLPMMFDAVSGKIVGILPLVFRPPLTCAFCFFARSEINTYIQKKQMYYTSEPFMNTLNTHPIRNGMESTILERMTQMSYSYAENGFLDYLMNNLRQMTWNSIGNYENCLNMVSQESIQSSEILYETITSKNFVYPIYLLLAIFIFSVAVLVCELIISWKVKSDNVIPVEVISRKVTSKKISSNCVSLKKYNKISPMRISQIKTPLKSKQRQCTQGIIGTAFLTSRV